jgi:hypothetical protein
MSIPFGFTSEPSSDDIAEPFDPEEFDWDVTMGEGYEQSGDDEGYA